MVDRARLYQDWPVNTGNGPLNINTLHARGKYGKKITTKWVAIMKPQNQVINLL